MVNSSPEPPSLEDILYTLNHVFLPPKLPQEEDHRPDRDVVLCRFVYDACREFPTVLPSQDQQGKWSTVVHMLKNLLESTQVLAKDVLITDILHLENGGWFFCDVRPPLSSFLPYLIQTCWHFTFALKMPPLFYVGFNIT